MLAIENDVPLINKNKLFYYHSRITHIQRTMEDALTAVQILVSNGFFY